MSRIVVIATTCWERRDDDGRNTFALPDLRSRVPVGQGQGTGLPSFTQGETGGSATNTLITSNLPAHSPTVNAVAVEGDNSSPCNNYPAVTESLDKHFASKGKTTSMNTGMIGTTGRNSPVNNMQPYLAIRYVICISGLYPSRN